MDKKGIRNLGKLLRKGENRKDFSLSAYSFISEMPEYKKADLIMAYLSLENEAPTDGIIERMLEDGKRVCVPVTKGRNMTPCEIDKNTEYVKGNFNVREPALVKEVLKEEIDIVIVPGLLFDRRGTRCGYGKGCYDFFLEGMKALRAGFAFESQVINAFPSEKHDVKMDYIITEKGLIYCGENKENS